MTLARNELPQGWKWATLGEVAKYINGKAFKPTEWEAQGLPIIRIQNLTNHRAEFHFTSNAVEERYLVRDGDLLISWSATLDAFIWNRGNAVLNQHIFKVAEDDQVVTKRFLYHAVRGHLQLLKGQVHGTGMQHITRGPFEATPIPLPPLPDQQRLVEKIERLLKQSRTAREALDRIPPLLKRFRQSVLAKAFRGELTERDPNDEPASVLLERIREERRRKREEDLRARGKDPRKAKYVEPESPDASGLPELPEGWVWASVAQIGDVRLGRQRSPSRAFGPNMTPYLRAANVTWTGLDLRDVKQMDFTPSEQGVYRLHVGDVVLSEASGSAREAGKPAIWRDEIPGCCFQNTLIRVRSHLLPAEYLRYHFLDDATSGRFAEATTGIGINHLGAKGLSGSPFALAPLTEQYRIVAILDAHLARVDAIEMAVNKGRRRAEHVDQALLARAFRGEL